MKIYLRGKCNAPVGCATDIQQGFSQRENLVNEENKNGEVRLHKQHDPSLPHLLAQHVAITMSMSRVPSILIKAQYGDDLSQQRIGNETIIKEEMARSRAIY